jgi:hypothetical protein
MGEIARDFGVLEAFIWDSGVVILTGNFQLISLNSFTEPRPVQIHVPLTQMPHSWTVVPPAKSLSRHIEVLLSVERTIYVADSFQCNDQVKWRL